MNPTSEGGGIRKEEGKEDKSCTNAQEIKRS